MIRQAVADIVKLAIKTQFKLDISPQISYPNASFGDLATNVAFELGQKLRKPPVEIAQLLVSKLKSADITEVRVAGGGFINLSFSDGFWIRQLDLISPAFTQNNSAKGQKVQVEFISANPTGPLTLGNARGGFVGDVLASVLKINGYSVTKEYYFNDGGTQVQELLKSVKAAAGEKVEGELQYKGSYVADLVKIYNPKLSDNQNCLVIADYIWDNYILPAIKRMGIEFDERTNERTLTAVYQQAIKHLGAGYIKTKVGAVWLLSSKFGDERDRVLEKSSGDRTYLANDIAYHYQIFAERGFDTAIKIWGTDHVGQVPSLKLTIKQLFPDKKLDFVLLQWVRLISGGKEVKMSKRAGTFVTVDDLLDQVEPAVARWFFLMHDFTTHIDFDLDLAKQQSQKNPYYYVMYAYVRAQAILKEAAKRGLKTAKSLTKLDQKEKLIIRQLSYLPELVAAVANTYQVHQLTFYGHELAEYFHDWYETTRVVELEPSFAAEKLYFLEKFIMTMNQYFAILGIKPKDRM